MKANLWRTVSILMCLAIIGCEKKAEQPSKPAAAPVAAVNKPPATQPTTPSVVAKPTTTAAKPAVAGPAEVSKRTVEAACGSCIFHMEGVTGCQLAVKIDGKPYLVTGANVDAHNAGLCSAAKQAEVTGAVKDGKFASTSFALKN